MNQQVFRKLHATGLITDSQLDSILLDEQRPVNLHTDLKTLLYTGILLLTTGLGIIVYKNIDTIGHLFIIIAIALGAAACFAYCFTAGGRFTSERLISPNLLFDYVLLTGCLLLLIFIGYIQYQYEVFGHRWGMATFIPMLILFFSAYYFDHLGVLSMAIVNMAAWLGISITPLHLLERNNFADDRIIYTGILLGIFLLVSAIFCVRMRIKEHFSFTYQNFGTHLLLMSLAAAMVHFDHLSLLYFLMLAAACSGIFYYALRERSKYFMVTASLYFYFGLSYIVTDGIFSMGRISEVQLYLVLFYYLLSGVGLIIFLMRFNRKLTHV